MVKNKIIFSISFFILACSVLTAKQLKVLHLGFHPGCAQDFEYVAQQLSLDLTTILITRQPAGWFDGGPTNFSVYNIGHTRAKKVWDKHKELFEQFDVIVTSDTAPLSRIFLQNGWKKPLVIWICNRFDYYDAASLDCQFPDQEYYQLFRNAIHQPNVTVVGYTPYEHFYAQQKNVYTGTLTIKPCAEPKNDVNQGAIPQNMQQSSIPKTVKKSETFFIPPYHNDTIFCDLAGICRNLGISVYRGRYNGPGDLKDFKGIIHLPYAWSNLALFENLANGLPYFIPSEKFVLELSRMGNYFFSNLSAITIKYSEWYLPEHKDIFVYFDSWQDLAYKIKTTDYGALRKRMKTFSENHRSSMLNKWSSVFAKYSKLIDKD